MEWIKISEQWPPADYNNFLYFDGENVFVAYLVDENYELTASIIQCHYCHRDAELKCDCEQIKLFVKPTDYWAKLDYPKEPEKKS